MSYQYVFNDKWDIVQYLKMKLPNASTIRIDITLYLLYAYFGACSEKYRKEINHRNYPTKLFPARFEACSYGPIEVDIRQERERPAICNDERLISVEQTIKAHSIESFFENILQQIRNLSDFDLVDRTHEDDCWFDNYKKQDKGASIDNTSIIEEYKKRRI